VLSDSFLSLLVTLGWDSQLLGENILDQRQEKRNILSNELGQVHVTKSTSDNHLLVSTWWLSSLGVTSGTQDGKNVSKTEIIMTLLGELLLAKCVQNIELNGEGLVSVITDGGKLDHHNGLSVGQHHGDTTEEHLKVLWELLTTSITGVMVMK